jgi:MFS family permease
MLMIVLDATVVNVALPSIQSDLGFSQSDLAWVVNAYMITFGGLLLLAGRLGDLIGSKRVFVAGIAVFTLASLLCGASISREMLVAARFLQGVGGAMASAVILSVIVIMFEDSHDRAKAMNMFSFTASAGGSIGLLVGGALTQAANWHWVFLVNIPIGIVVLVLANRVLAPGTALGLRAGADALGAFLITASLMLAVYAVVEIPVARATSPQTLLTGTLALALFAAFIARQAMAAKPLLPLGVFRNRNLSGSNVLQVLLVAGLYGFFFLDSLYLRQQLHYSAFTTGLAFLPITIAIGALSLGWSTHLVTHFGARNVCDDLSRDGAARRRTRRLVSVAHDVRDVERDTERFRPHFGSHEYHGGGRRRPRPRYSRDRREQRRVPRRLRRRRSFPRGGEPHRRDRSRTRGARGAASRADNRGLILRPNEVPSRALPEVRLRVRPWRIAANRIVRKKETLSCNSG